MVKFNFLLQTTHDLDEALLSTFTVKLVFLLSFCPFNLTLFFFIFHSFIFFNFFIFRLFIYQNNWQSWWSFNSYFFFLSIHLFFFFNFILVFINFILKLRCEQKNWENKSRKKYWKNQLNNNKKRHSFWFQFKASETDWTKLNQT